jgi:hypothetical protein
MDREWPLAAVLPRQPGTKEARYAHLLSGPVESIVQPVSNEPVFGNNAIPASGDMLERFQERFERLEATVEELRREVAALNQKVDDLFG